MKIKREMNKHYTVIAIYVIVTCVVIYCLSIIANNLDVVYDFIMSKVTWVLGVLKPVVFAFAFAYIMHPIVELIEKFLVRIKFFEERKEKARTIAVLLTLVSFILMISIVLSLFVFSVTKQMKVADFGDFISITNQYMNNFNDFYASLQERIDNIDFQSDEIKKYLSDIAGYALQFVQGLLTNVVGSVSSITSSLATLVITFVLGTYMLIDEKILKAYLHKVTYAFANRKANKVMRVILEDMDHCFSGYVKGQLLDAIVMGIAISVTLSLVGVKFAIIIGICAGIGNLIPYCGPFVAYFGTGVVCLLNGEIKTLIMALILLIVIQAIDGNIIGPKLLGMSVQIHPILIMVSLIIGGAIGGLWGMLLAVPCGALVKIWFGRLIDYQLSKKDQTVDYGDVEDNADVAD